MKHYQTKPTFIAPPPPPAVPMRRLLEERKAVLELQVRARLRSAREGDTSADVKALSAALRTVKAQIAKLDQKTTAQGEAHAAAPDNSPRRLSSASGPFLDQRHSSETIKQRTEWA